MANELKVRAARGRQHPLRPWSAEVNSDGPIWDPVLAEEIRVLGDVVVAASQLRGRMSEPQLDRVLGVN